MGFFGDAKGIQGSSEEHKLGRAIKTTFGSKGLFGDSYAKDRVAFVEGTFKSFLDGKNFSQGHETSYGAKTIEPHEVEQALSIIEAGAERYKITPDQIQKLRTHVGDMLKD